MKAQIPEVSSPIASVEKDGIRVEFVYIGEGLCGDYDEDNSDDEPLLRFDVYKNGEFVDDSSYCTTIRADADIEYVKQVAQTILNQVYEPLINGRSIRKLCESLSWL